MMGQLNSFSASGGGNLNKNFPKIQMPRGVARGGMLKLRFDWYIILFINTIYMPLLRRVQELQNYIRKRKYAL